MTRPAALLLIAALGCGARGDLLNVPPPFATTADSIAIARLVAQDLRTRPGGRLRIRTAAPCPAGNELCRRLGDWGASTEAATRFIAPIRGALGDTIPDAKPTRAVCPFVWAPPPDSVKATATHEYFVAIHPPVFAGDSATLMVDVSCLGFRRTVKSGFAQDDRLTFRRTASGWRLVSRVMTRIT